MNSTLLFRQFSTALNWNAFLYAAHKSVTTFRTLFLYHFLSASDFSTWAILNSTIFLVLLWADCGLRKSIPRYASEFYHQKSSFFYGLIIFYSAILLAAIPPLIWLISHSSRDPIICALVMSIFIAEAINTVMRLIYHAYLYNRSFNLMATIIITIEATFTCAMVPIIHTSTIVLFFLFAFKLLASIALIAISILSLKKQPTPLIAPSITAPNKKHFLIHSLIMWITTILKSLSEQNFLIPFIGYTVSTGEGNLFKVASDGAVLCYRIILKTIGSADTALLTHVEIEGDKNLMIIAVKKLTTKITRLCFPVIGIIGIISLIPLWWHHYNPFIFKTFLIMATGYITETMLLPYERVLEVRRNYKAIIICYLPYISTLIFLILRMRMSSIGLLSFLIIIQGVRLVSCLLMRYAVHRLYHI